ncbi:hypothetical protein GCM10022245_34830 [Streptomyces mayteni]
MGSGQGPRCSFPHRYGEPTGCPAEHFWSESARGAGSDADTGEVVTRMGTRRNRAATARSAARKLFDTYDTVWFGRITRKGRRPQTHHKV